MAQVKFHKYVAALPAQLEANAIYYVRAGAGFDLYVTNSSGTIVAYPANYLKQDGTAADASKLGGQLAAQYYRRANILGAVSQSSGVPTGAIIERGTNANGKYVRYADGTQICSFTSANRLSTSLPIGAVYQSPSSIGMTFPAPFVSAPEVIPGADDAQGAICWACTGGVIAAAGCVVWIVSGIATASAKPSYVAKGRWF